MSPTSEGRSLARRDWRKSRNVVLASSMIASMRSGFRRWQDLFGLPTQAKN